MRAASPSAIKGSDLKTLSSTLPGEGTKLRLLYDILYEHRGRIVPLDEMTALIELTKSTGGLSCLGNLVRDLVDYYGCDIRSLTPPRGDRRTVKGRRQRDYVLVGEWSGMRYRDYVLEAACAETQPADA